MPCLCSFAFSASDWSSLLGGGGSLASWDSGLGCCPCAPRLSVRHGIGLGWLVRLQLPLTKTDACKDNCIGEPVFHSRLNATLEMSTILTIFSGTVNAEITHVIQLWQGVHMCQTPVKPLPVKDKDKSRCTNSEGLYELVQQKTETTCCLRTQLGNSRILLAVSRRTCVFAGSGFWQWVVPTLHLCLVCLTPRPAYASCMPLKTETRCHCKASTRHNATASTDCTALVTCHHTN